MTTTTPNGANVLAERLRRSAEESARSALARVTSDEQQVQAVIDAGTAVEHMTKAYLANLHPTLLTERGADFDTLLHLSGLGALAKTKPHTVRTVSGHEACQRTARILPAFKYIEKVDQAVFVGRNAGAHLASSSQDAAHESARIMVRLMEPLITALDLDRARFWGDMLSAADTLLDESITQIKAILEVKFAAARRRLATRLEGLSGAERRLVLLALGGDGEYLSDTEHPFECPVCEQQGYLLCEVDDIGAPEFEYEQVDVDDFIYHGGFIDRRAFAFAFACSVCGLDLQYEELELVDLPDHFDLDPRSCEPHEFDDDRY